MDDALSVSPRMSAAIARRALIRLLQHAHAGERAAALAYRGHARSVRGEERATIARIEQEELEHRSAVGAMLRELGSEPDRVLELRRFAIGATLGFLCRFAGWFFPMFGAGMLERRNIGEYETAARLALLAGASAFCRALLHMAEVEHDHERYFRDQAASHLLWKWVPRWSAPPPRADIARSFEAFKDSVRARALVYALATAS